MKIKESDLAKQLIQSFDGSQYEIYQEVGTPCGVADIVIKSNFIWSIEVKTSLSLAVMAQARNNLRYFNFSSICVPRPRKGNTNGAFFAREICKSFGIGIFKIDQFGEVNEIKAKFQRKALTKKIDLYEIQKTYAEAGNSNGRRWTPFNQTCLELAKYVSKNPGCKLRDALKHIKHHYASISSACQSIPDLIDRGIIDTITTDKDKRLNIKK